MAPSLPAYCATRGRSKMPSGRPRPQQRACPSMTTLDNLRTRKLQLEQQSKGNFECRAREWIEATWDRSAWTAATVLPTSRMRLVFDFDTVMPPDARVVGLLLLRAIADDGIDCNNGSS